jgi:hypothetical protein
MYNSVHITIVRHMKNVTDKRSVAHIGLFIFSQLAMMFMGILALWLIS